MWRNLAWPKPRWQRDDIVAKQRIWSGEITATHLSFRFPINFRHLVQYWYMYEDNTQSPWCLWLSGRCPTQSWMNPLATQSAALSGESESQSEPNAECGGICVTNRPLATGRWGKPHIPIKSVYLTMGVLYMNICTYVRICCHYVDYHYHFFIILILTFLIILLLTILMILILCIYQYNVCV